VNGFPLLRRLRSTQDLLRVEEAAARDSHRVVGATHLIEKDGLVVGYASLGGVPLVNVWLDSQRVSPRESVSLLNLGENLLAAQGSAAVLMPCAEQSPFSPLMGRLGYERLGPTTLYMKGL